MDLKFVLVVSQAIDFPGSIPHHWSSRLDRKRFNNDAKLTTILQLHAFGDACTCSKTVNDKNSWRQMLEWTSTPTDRNVQRNQPNLQSNTIIISRLLFRPNCPELFLLPIPTRVVQSLEGRRTTIKSEPRQPMVAEWKHVDVFSVSLYSSALFQKNCNIQT